MSRELRLPLLPILQDVLPTPLQDAPLRFLAAASQEQNPNAGSDTPLPPDPKRKKRIHTLQELLTTYPEMTDILIDATEQAVPRPADKLKRKQAYSGKQQEHTVKTLIVATRKTILHVFGGLPGCIHDRCVLRASGVLRQVPAGVRVRVEKGYQGADTASPDVAVQQPCKKPRNQDFTILERAYNDALSVQRIYVEHPFARVEKWGGLAQEWRGKFCDHEGVFCVIVGLVTFRETGKFDLVS